MSKLPGFKVTHEELRREIVKLLTLYHYKTYWTWKSYHSPKGYPDLTATRGTRTIWIEIKVGKDKLSPEQIVWHNALKENPHNEVYVWREVDPMDELARILR